MALTNPIIQQQLQEKFGESVSAMVDSYGLLEITAPRELNLKVLNFLYDNPTLQFQFLTDLTGVHYLSKKGNELAVVYHLHSLKENLRVRFKVFAPLEQPEVYTATGLFSAANWMERETYDFFGILFLGHPNLKRILNVEQMDYFPLRKEFPLEDQTRIDKDDEMFGRGGTLKQID